MALPTEKLGTTYAPTTTVIDADRAKQYAAATNDDNPAYTSGKFAPPVFGVVPTWDVMGLAVGDVVPAEALMMVVHGEQDMHFHRPLVPGESLVTTSESYAVRVGGSGTRFTVKVVSTDPAGDPVLEQYVTIFIRGMSDGESAGPDKPDHDFPEPARSQPAGSYTVHVDDDQTYRYHEASGDPMPIHLDDAFAKSVGLPGIIAHGLCTMAMCSQAVINTLAGGDPARLKRLAVRFAANVFPGNDVVVDLFDAGVTADGRRAYVFEATSAGAVVVKNGWAEVEGEGSPTGAAMAVVRLFASARDAAGTGRDTIPGATVAEVLDAARARYGEAFAAVLAGSRVWLNGEAASGDDVVGDRDEVAVLPPVSGGSG